MTVPILRLPLHELPMIEGNARLIGAVPGAPSVWVVKFKGEKRTRKRLVCAALLGAPDAVLAALTLHWMHSVQPERLAEFPRDDTDLPATKQGAGSPAASSTRSPQRRSRSTGR